MRRNKYLIALLFLLISSCQIQSKRGIIISKLKNASKLSTVEVSLTKYVYNTDELSNIWDDIIGRDKVFLARTEATLKLGIDLSKIEQDDIRIRGTSIQIKLPPVEVINFSYPAEKFEVDVNISDFDTDKINRKKAHKIDKIYQAAELQIWEHIDEIGMHKTVEDKTEKLIRKILENLGFTEIYISFQPKKPFKFTIDDPMIDSLLI